ncbi:MAG: hypothetical protein FJX76_00580 [Armatimonadetes bacterium]|nr:hypothetical protein [Armatimonadota bacterium]
MARMSDADREMLMKEATKVSQSSERGGKYRTYDFTRPDKLSNEQKRQLRNQFEPVCRWLCIHFGSQLRTVVEMWLLDVDEIRYRDVFNEPPHFDGKSVVAVFSPGPELPQGVVQASTPLLFAFLERMMGGIGVTEMPDKDLSEFEKSLFSQIMMRILNYFAKTFPDELSPAIERVETEAALVPRSYAPEESMVRQIFRISLNGFMGHFIISLPFEFFRPRVAQMRTGSQWRHIGPVEPHRVEELGVVDVPMVVELGRASLNLKRLMELAAGDVIELNGSVTVTVGDVPKFVARPGMVGERVAVEIVKPVDEEREDIIVQ